MARAESGQSLHFAEPSLYEVCQRTAALRLMALQMHRYTLFGFSSELDWRPLHFVEPIPAQKICEVCGLLSKWAIFLPCRHVVCKMCYEQCFVNDVYECPIDSVQFCEENVQWMEFPVENLLKRKVKCWNEENGCDAIMNLSGILRHFAQDCDHHSTRCPNCSALVLCRRVCAHRRSNCSMRASFNQAQQLQPSKDSVEEAMFTALETILEEHAKEMKSGLDQVVRDHNTIYDRLNEVSHIVNGLRETVIQTSKNQARTTNEARIAAVRELREDLAAQGDRIDEVSQRITAFHEDGKGVVEATKQFLENLEQSNSEIRRRIAADDNRLERVSEAMSSFKVVFDEALERATEIMSQKFTTYIDFCAAEKPKEAESGQKASNETENQLLAQKTLGIKNYWFCVKEISTLKQQAISKGNARFFCEPIYLCGYRISPGLYLQNNENSVLVHARAQLHKGVIDEFLQWPFSHNVKLTFMGPSLDKGRELLSVTPFDLRHFGRPTAQRIQAFYLTASLPLEDLERDGCVKSDQLCVKFELVP